MLKRSNIFPLTNNSRMLNELQTHFIDIYHQSSELGKSSHFLKAGTFVQVANPKKIHINTSFIFTKEHFSILNGLVSVC